MIELESCPFCGMPSRISYGDDFGEFYVIAMCCSCGIRTPKFYYTNNETERGDAIMMVAKRWNRRANDDRIKWIYQQTRIIRHC